MTRRSGAPDRRRARLGARRRRASSRPAARPSRPRRSRPGRSPASGRPSRRWRCWSCCRRRGATAGRATWLVGVVLRRDADPVRPRQQAHDGRQRDLPAGHGAARTCCWLAPFLLREHVRRPTSVHAWRWRSGLALVFVGPEAAARHGAESLRRQHRGAPPAASRGPPPSIGLRWLGSRDPDDSATRAVAGRRQPVPALVCSAAGAAGRSRPALHDWLIAACAWACSRSAWRTAA